MRLRAVERPRRAPSCSRPARLEFFAGAEKETRRGEEAVGGSGSSSNNNNNNRQLPSLPCRVGRELRQLLLAPPLASLAGEDSMNMIMIIGALVLVAALARRPFQPGREEKEERERARC